MLVKHTFNYNDIKIDGDSAREVEKSDTCLFFLTGEAHRLFEADMGASLSDYIMGEFKRDLIEDEFLRERFVAAGEDTSLLPELEETVPTQLAVKRLMDGNFFRALAAASYFKQGVTRSDAQSEVTQMEFKSKPFFYLVPMDVEFCGELLDMTLSALPEFNGSDDSGDSKKAPH